MADTKKTLDRFRKKNRPSVSRDASLANSNDSKESTTELISHQEDQVDGLAADSLVQKLILEIEEAPALAPTRNLRIEQETLDGLSQWCKEHKITIDNFVDAAYSLCQSNEKFKQKVLDNAQDRYQYRKAIARKKRTLTEIQRN